jgi:hypothetical protein
VSPRPGVGWRVVGALAALAVMAAGARPAPAQPGIASLDAVSGNPALITAQFRVAANLIREVLPALGAMQSGEEAQPLRPKLNRIYVLIRAGMAGLKVSMDDARNQHRFIDPLVPYQYEKVTAAWHLARRPVDTFTTAGGAEWYEYRAMVERQLGQALTILEEVLVLR